MNKFRFPVLAFTVPAMVCLTAAVAFGQFAGNFEDPFAPQNTTAFDVKIEYDLGRSSVKTIYVTPSSHWDWEFTDPDDVERDQLVAHIDDLIETARAHPDFRWQEEAIWHIEAWMRSDPAPDRAEALFSLLRSGQVSVGATEYMVTSLPDEILGRIGYKAADYAERYNVPFETAVAADYVGLSWMQVQSLARSGVKYLINSHHIAFPPPDGLSRKPQPYWWEGPDGSRILVWRIEYTSAIYPYCVNPQAARFFSSKEMGKEATALDDLELTAVALKHQLRRLEEEGYDKDAILLIDSHDNVKPSGAVRLIDHFRKWNETHDTPKLRLATPEEFFRHMADTYGPSLPVFRGEYRDAFQGAVYRQVSGRQAATDLVEAEKLWSFADLAGANAFPALMDRQTLVDLLQSASHGGGAWWASQLQTDYTRLRRDQLNAILPARANYLRKMALSTLGQRIFSDPPALAVVNDLSWNRTGIVEIPVVEEVFPKGSRLKDAVTGTIVPIEWASFETSPTAERMPGPQKQKKWFLGELGYARLRFRAEDVPAMGYKLFHVVSGGEGPATPSATTLTTTSTVETKFFRVILSPSGQILGLYDKQAQREMVAADAKSPFASLKVVTFRGMRNRRTPEINTTDLDAKSDATVIRQGPVATVVDVRRPNDIVTRTQVIFSEAASEIRIRHVVNEEKLKGLGRSRWQTVTVSLPFSYKTRQFQSRIQMEQTVRDKDTNESTRPAGEFALGAIGWGAYFTDGSHGTFLSSREITDIPDFFNKEQSECVTVRLNARPGASPPGEEAVCEFVISTDAGATDASEIYRRSLAGVYPLRATPTRTGELMPWETRDDYLGELEQSFVTVSSADVIVTAFKRARGGKPNEYALRLLETGGRNSAKTKVTFPRGIKAAYLADQTERMGQKLLVEGNAVSLDVGRNQLLTLRLEF